MLSYAIQRPKRWVWEETCPVADSAFGHVEGIDDGDASIASSGDSILQVSTTVEDVFWILKKSLSRAMATGVIDCVCGVLNNAAATLQRDFVLCSFPRRENEVRRSNVDAARQSAA